MEPKWRWGSSLRSQLEVDNLFSWTYKVPTHNGHLPVYGSLPSFHWACEPRVVNRQSEVRVISKSISEASDENIMRCVVCTCKHEHCMNFQNPCSWNAYNGAAKIYNESLTSNDVFGELVKVLKAQKLSVRLIRLHNKNNLMFTFPCVQAQAHKRTQVYIRNVHMYISGHSELSCSGYNSPPLTSRGKWRSKLELTWKQASI